MDEIFSNETLHPGDLKAALEAALMKGLHSSLLDFLPPDTDLNRLTDDAFPVPGKKGSKKAVLKPATPVKNETVKAREKNKKSKLSSSLCT